MYHISTIYYLKGLDTKLIEGGKGIVLIRRYYYSTGKGAILDII